MDLRLEWLNHDTGSSLGAFFIDGLCQCFACGDEPRKVKVNGETRLRAGRYPVTLRKEGGFHQRFLAKYGAWHAGMLWIRDVPEFEFILLHPGNDEGDTEGCVLPGLIGLMHAAGGGKVGNSVQAYEKIYPPVRDALLRGEPVFLTVVDRD